jgi:predicted ester cyclase
VSAHEVVAAYWAAAEARDWDAFGELVADDVVYEMAQTGERVRGRDAYVRFNREGFPSDWHLTVRRIVAEGSLAASWIDFTEAGQTETGLCFFELDAAGRISRIDDAWPQPYEMPEGRARLVERFRPGAG